MMSITVIMKIKERIVKYGQNINFSICQNVSFRASSGEPPNLVEFKIG